MPVARRHDLIDRIMQVPAQLVGEPVLLGNRGRDLGCVARQIVHGPANGADLDHGPGCRALDGVDLLDDVLGRLGGLAGKRLDLLSDDGEAPARLPGPRRLESWR